MTRRSKPTHATPARLKTLECLEIVRTRDAFASDVIDAVIDKAPLGDSDRAFATRLVLGVVSMQGTLDRVLDMCMRSPDDVQPNVRDALRISAYELLFLGKDAHAAVDQGVELARCVQPKAAGVANAVLRKVAKAARSFPFGDPQGNMAVFAFQQGFPPWLAELLVGELGTDNARKFMVASNEPAPIYIAINPLKDNAGETLKRIKAIDPLVHAVKVASVEVPGCWRLENPKVLADKRFLKLIAGGHVLVSDASAQTIAFLACHMSVAFAQKSGKGLPLSCLELCAGRGTKTILLQGQSFLKTGLQMSPYDALDNVAFKTKLLADRAAKYDAKVDESICADLIDADGVLDGRTYDLVFLDSPCSGLGTLRRHPEIRWRIAPDVIADAAKLDAKLIDAASDFVAPGGTFVYSTCTVTNAENARIVRRFLESSKGSRFSLVPINGSPVLSTTLEPGGPDAHFCAIMRRNAP